ncbi:MAG: M48 family metalloprotease [Acidobacteria bacterium]|nr:M48 family metalloprotease [Acidobacteriota bacterium]
MSTKTLDADAVVSALSRPLPPARTALSYRAGLLVVSGLMILLGLVYLAVVGAALAFDLWLLYQAAGELRHGLRGALLLCVPLFGALLFTVFLVKPLIAPRRHERPVVSLHPTEEPFLFDFIARLARKVGAPVPDRIDVDSMINASAGLHLGMVERKNGRLVLTIGLPLAAGLSLRELTGVLAHELGHFRQGAGMRLSRLVSRVNLWLARLAFERDGWDVMLVGMSEDREQHLFTRLLLWCVRGLVSVTRLVVMGLAWLGHVMSFWLTRQMELDADRWEALVAGETTFRETSWRLRVLGAASQVAYDDLANAYREGRLADDFPAFVIDKATSLPPALVTHLETLFLESRTGLFDSHPSDAERIERVAGSGEGIFDVPGPASGLFRDFPALCKRVTLQHYRAELGVAVKVKTLVGTTEMLSQGKARSARRDDTLRYFQGLITSRRPFFLGVSGVPAPPPDALARLKAARQAFEAALPKAKEAFEKQEMAQSLRFGASAAESLVNAGVPFDATPFGIPTSNAWAIRRATERAEVLEGESAAGVAHVEKVQRARILLALASLDDAALREKAAVSDAEREKARGLVRTLFALEATAPHFAEISVFVTSFAALLDHADGHERNPVLVNHYNELMGALTDRLSLVRTSLKQTPYPYEHAAKDATLVKYLIPADDLPESAAIGGLASESYDRFRELYSRALSDLVVLAMRVEVAAGLPEVPKLPDPKEQAAAAAARRASMASSSQIAPAG